MQRCGTRVAAQRAGEMFYHYNSRTHWHGWVFPAVRGAAQPWPPFFHTHCPFCGGALPDLSVPYGHILRELTTDEGDE